MDQLKKTTSISSNSSNPNATVHIANILVGKENAPFDSIRLKKLDYHTLNSIAEWWDNNTEKDSSTFSSDLVKALSEDNILGKDSTEFKTKLCDLLINQMQAPLDRDKALNSTAGLLSSFFLYWNNRPNTSQPIKELRLSIEPIGESKDIVHGGVGGSSDGSSSAPTPS